MKIRSSIKICYIIILLLTVVFSTSCSSPTGTKKEQEPKTKEAIQNCTLPFIEPITDPNIVFPGVRVEGVVKISENCVTWEVESNKSYTLIWYENSATFNSDRREVTFITSEGGLFSSPKGKQFKIKNGDKVSLGGGLLGKEQVRFIVPPCPDCPTLYWLVDGTPDLID